MVLYLMIKYFLPLFFIINLSWCDTQWDLLIFTQTWPNTLCIDHHGHCLLPNQQAKFGWRIHGLWPTRLHTIGPSFCNKSLPFDLNALKPLFDQLKQNWPNLLVNHTEDSLWEHEWLKHGTCAVSDNELDSEVKYFAKGLELYNKYSMTKVLSLAGLAPSKSPTIYLSQINEAVLYALGKRADIVCTEMMGESYLFEIRICFDKSLQLIDCDGIRLQDKSNNILSNCPIDKPIIYPDSFKTGYSLKNDLLYNFIQGFLKVYPLLKLLGP